MQFKAVLRLVFIGILAIGVNGLPADLPALRFDMFDTTPCPDWVLFDGRYEITDENNLFSEATRSCECANGVQKERLICLKDWNGVKCSCADPGYCPYPGKGYSIAPQGLLIGSEVSKPCEIECADGFVGLIKRKCLESQKWSNRKERCKCHNAWQKVSNGDCWRRCGHKAGGCSKCGTGGVVGAEFRGFCCRKGRNDSGCTATQAEVGNNPNRHVCVESAFGLEKHVPLLITTERRIPLDCRTLCGGTGQCAACDKYGRTGYCCKNGANDSCTAIQQSVAIDPIGYVCVTKKLT